MSERMNEDTLAADRIAERLSPGVREQLSELTILQETDSTNSALAQMPASRRHAHVVLADSQTAGRGRRQRNWHSPAGGNIYLSLGWRFATQPVTLSTLPLVAALCLCRALQRAGLQGHGVKWPNDVLFDGKKVAGVLVESQSTGSGPTLAIIGIGLNVRMPGSATGMPVAAIDRPWTDLVSLLPQERCSVSRNELVALLLEELLPGLALFESRGFSAFQAEWNERDLLSGKRLRLEGNGGFRYGRAIGIDDNGGLEVDIDGYGPQVLYAADVSIHDA